MIKCCQNTMVFITLTLGTVCVKLCVRKITSSSEHMRSDFINLRKMSLLHWDIQRILLEADTGCLNTGTTIWSVVTGSGLFFIPVEYDSEGGGRQRNLHLIGQWHPCRGNFEQRGIRLIESRRFCTYICVWSLKSYILFSRFLCF